MDNFTNDLRNIVLNHVEPFLIKDILNWDILKWDLNDWSLLLNKEDLEFRCGKYEFSKSPQWEGQTKIIKETFDKFSILDPKLDKKWLYFDYKYLNEYLKDKPQLHNSISWKIVGFPEYNAKDSTLWIGSEGAHTPCHQDTYGTNLVAQIYGKKRWIIFPPDENLFSTRIPYEESSIYSKLNFFSPDNIDNFRGIKRCKSVVLEAGDVLFIPNGWWHYVENLEISISVNVWIPLNSDPKKQLKESLVQMFVSQIIKDMDVNKQQTILNPNMEKLNLHTQDISKSINIINICRQNCKKEIMENTNDVNDIFDKYPNNLIKIPNLPTDDFIKLMQQQASRFKDDETFDDLDCSIKNNFTDILDAFLSEDVINLVVEKLLKE